MYKVAVLLSTYNGEAYLKEQLDSILCQEGVEVLLLVRDDGSNDSTQLILNDYAARHQNVELHLMGNVGFKKSFEWLSRYAYKYLNADFYAYADQDDVWMTDKLNKSISAISLEKLPALYCCNQIITDKSLKPLHLMLNEKNYKHTCEVQNMNFFKNRHGCTMVWNKAMMVILGESKHDESYTPGHDKWLTLLARCSGKVFIGKEPLQYYRVHNSNTSGYAQGIYNRLIKAIKVYWLTNQQSNLYAKDCLNSIPHIENTDGVRFIVDVANYKNSFLKRIKVAMSHQVWGEGIIDGLIHSTAVLIGKY